MADSQGDINQNVISYAHTVFWNSLNNKMGCFILLFYVLTVRNVYFHSDFCGCFQKRSTLILYMHFFFYFSPSCPEHKMYSRVMDSVGVVSALCSVAHFFFHVPTCSLSKIGRAALDRNSPVFKYIQCILDSFLTYICCSSFFLFSVCNFTVYFSFINMTFLQLFGTSIFGCAWMI